MLRNIMSQSILGQVFIDGRVFRLYYLTNVTFLVICATVLGLFQFLGDPIECGWDQKFTAEAKIVDDYCWAQMDFFKQDKFIRQYSEPYFQYFKWTFFYLFFQIFTFQLPHKLWSILEGNRISRFTSLIKDDPNGEKRGRLAAILGGTIKGQYNNFYLWLYLFCSLLNPLLLAGHIHGINYFLDYQFTSYGIDSLKFLLRSGDPATSYDPMAWNFPKVISCEFPWYLNVRQVLCVLPINFINDKIFFFSWFWFAALLILSAIEATLWICTLLSVRIREWRLMVLPVQGVPTEAFRRNVELIVSNCSVGDWFVLQLLNPLSPSDLFGDHTKYKNIVGK